MIKKGRDIDSHQNGIGFSGSTDGHEFGAYQSPSTRVRWGSVTQFLPSRGITLGEVRDFIRPMRQPPVPHDVMIAEVQFCGRHNAIELDCGRKSTFDEGDVLAVAFGNRYATSQFFGEVPGLSSEYHLLSQGGVCGRVVSAPKAFDAPTVLKPLGYLVNDRGLTVNLRDHARRILPIANRPPVILVVGSSMDAGKTTSAASVARGLSRCGLRVNAGKLTGTACRKDLFAMFDAGAQKTLDFNCVGFSSTAGISENELQEIADVLISNLSADSPDYVVLEIADGIIQRETMQLLSLMKSQELFQYLVLAVHDVLSAPTCVTMLEQRWGIVPTVISGIATQSPLSMAELDRLTVIPNRSQEQLSSPEIRSMFTPVAPLLPTADIRFSSNEPAVVG